MDPRFGAFIVQGNYMKNLSYKRLHFPSILSNL